MSNPQERLISCFQIIFPNLSPDEILRASNTSVAGWDSLATVTLVSVIEEEFGVTVMPEDYESVVSFARVYEYLKRETANA